jgi:hypothetical protein
MKGGAEYDAFTRWKNWISWRAGERKAIKRGFNRRCRRESRIYLRTTAEYT